MWEDASVCVVAEYEDIRGWLTSLLVVQFM